MKRRFLHYATAVLALLSAHSAQALAGGFSFAVIAPQPQATQSDSILREVIADTDRDSLAFVVASGIKAEDEPCSDAVYLRHRELLNSAKNGLIVSLAGSDWIDCRDSRGRSVALERLNRVRELFYGDEFSFGSSRIPVTRQSTIPKFRSYAENMRWEVGNVMFGTLNLPAKNNHYAIEAGRNSEFEDRLIANREWMQRIFVFAKRKRFAGIVLFCDGDPLAEPGFLDRFTPGAKRDGFLEARRQLLELARKYKGKVLVVSNHATEAEQESDLIRWHENIGRISARTAWTRLRVDAASPSLFSVDMTAEDAGEAQPAIPATDTKKKPQD